MSTELPKKRALSIFYDPSKLIGRQYKVEIHLVEQPADRAAMLNMLSEHLNHLVNGLAAMLNTAIRDFEMDKSGVFNEVVSYITTMRDSPNNFIEFIPPIVNRNSKQLLQPLQLELTYNPFADSNNQYHMSHTTMLTKPETRSEVLEILLVDIVHVTNGLVYILNKIEGDFFQNRIELYNSVAHQLVLIRSYGLDLSKESPTFAKGKAK